MPGKRAFEEQVAALDALRQQPPESRSAPLRKALGHKNNFIVAKAANLIHDFGLKDLEPDLLAAFDRFFDDPVKTDPQCWAKNAISRTLAAMELQDEQVFLRGMRHIQMEPVWGGQSDTAGNLRATCALALVQCRSLTERDLLANLVELLADKGHVFGGQGRPVIAQRLVQHPVHEGRALEPADQTRPVEAPRHVGALLGEDREREPPRLAGRQARLEEFRADRPPRDAKPGGDAVQERLRVGFEVVEEGEKQRLAAEVAEVPAQVGGVTAMV